MSTQDSTPLEVGPPKQRVLQALGSSDCVVATCAMITSTTLEEAHAWAGTSLGEPWHDCVAAAYLLKNGIWMGYGIGLDEPMKVEADWNFSNDGKLLGQPAYMAVRSKSDPEGSHAVFWDGNVVWDPHPWAGDAEPLDNYEVSDFWPLFKLPYLMAKRMSNLRLG
jgi:hypothetical protein